MKKQQLIEDTTLNTKGAETCAGSIQYQTKVPEINGIPASDARKAFKDKRTQFVQDYLDAVDDEIERQINFKDKLQLNCVKIYLNQSVGLFELQSISYALEMRGYTTLFESANNAFIVRWG